MEHTPEPWQVIPWPSAGATSLGVATKGTADGLIAMMSVSHKLREVNARRIVACVNACVGLPTDVLEANTVKELMAMAYPITPAETEAALELAKTLLPPE